MVNEPSASGSGLWSLSSFSGVVGRRKQRIAAHRERAHMRAEKISMRRTDAFAWKSVELE